MGQDDHDLRRRDEEAERLRESAAILRRVRQETDPQIGAHAERMAAGLRGHFGAADVDQADPIEVIGTRIGRLAGLAAFAVLAVILLLQILKG